MTDTSTHRKFKALLVEDDPFLLKMYQKKFEVANFEVQLARDGEEGIQQAKKFLPDIIMMDIMMPKVNGIQALERLKSDPTFADTPIVILTNLSSTDDAGVAIQKGAIQYLVKSDYTPAQIVAVATKILNGTAAEVASQP